MSFADRITRLPLPHDPARGADARAACASCVVVFGDLVEGAAGSSPYLAGLIARESDWLVTATNGTPEDALAQILVQIRGLDEAELAQGLRRLKRRIALLTAIADLGGVWSLEEVTGALTEFADLAVSRALVASIRREAQRGRLPGVDPDTVSGDSGGMAVLAVGKMGARELNYSSDIDLICLFDDSRFAQGDYQDARAGFIRATKAMTALLSEATGDGYVFRTDLRLRPDPSVTPVCLAMDAAERYYESLGRTWERAAYIKARVCAGDIAAGEAFLARLTPFVWRKHLDFAAIEDAHNMRLRIREHKGLGGPIALAGHDMKLGRGGIREIEFFTQTRQIIAGGREPALRQRGTVAGLEALTQGGWVGAEVSEPLITDYRAHRETEHRLQMVADAQTHALPASDDGFKRLALLSGQADVAALRRDLRARLERVLNLTEPFFAPGSKTTEVSTVHAGTAARWLRLPALRSERARDRFERLRPMLFARLDAAPQPTEAVAAFEGFLAGLPAGVQLFALFEANPQLVDLIVDIASTAPGLAQYLGRNAQVLDAVIGGSFFEAWPGVAALVAELAATLARAPDYEARLDSARRWMKEWHFGIGVHHLRGLIDAAQAGRQYSDLADAVLQGLLPVVTQEFSRKHGTPPGRGAAVVGMGSLGAQLLSSGSDLDLIVIYDADGDATSDGPRPLAARSYNARLTQGLVTALSARMAEGKLYEVDMRLRPSGRKGPVATGFGSFQHYQRDEAWGWEHLALTRARPIAGPTPLTADIEAFRAGFLGEIGAAPKVVADISEMRARLDMAKPRGSVWQVKEGPGGMRDIELFAQGAALIAGQTVRATADQIVEGARIGWIEPQNAQRLTEAYQLLSTVLIAARLLQAPDLELANVGSGGQAFVLRAANMNSIDALAQALQAAYDSAAAIIGAALDAPPAT